MISVLLLWTESDVKVIAEMKFVDIISSPGGFSYVLHRSNFSVKFNSNKPNGLGVEGRRRPLEHNREGT